MFFDDCWVPFGRLWGGALGTKVEEKVVENKVLLRTPPGGAIWKGFGSILIGFGEDFGAFWEDLGSILGGFREHLERILGGTWLAVCSRFACFLLLVYFGFACVLLPAGRFFVPFRVFPRVPFSSLVFPCSLRSLSFARFPFPCHGRTI